MRRLLTLNVAVLLLLGLSGCSTIRLAYNQADHVAAWMAEDYFDLTPDQKHALLHHFDRFHAWHRSTQLPDYVTLLENTRQRVAAGATVADADWLTAAVQARMQTMVRQAYKDAGLMLAQLSDEQVQAARREFERRNRKYVREAGIGATPEEQRRLRARRHIERIEHWTGALDPALEARVRDLSRALPLIVEQRHQERLRRQNEFIALLQQRKNPDVFAPRLRDWVLGWERTRAPAYYTEYTQFMQESSRMYVAVLQMLSAEQRSHVAAVLQRYQHSLRNSPLKLSVRQGPCSHETHVSRC